jgi:ribonuclease HI
MTNNRLQGKEIQIYTDGAASGNPGPGGFGVVLKYKDKRKELSRGYERTTNNRMELLAVIAALEQLKQEGCRVILHTDSRYVSEAVNRGWLFDWERKNFKKKKNPDLWKRFLTVYRKHDVQIIWIKGHADNIENNRCDTLAVEAYQSGKLFIDEGYVSDDQLTID